ncbi:hypothetical protein E2562_033452 [Oryza meyeriana var. granulata]|uniref:Uncharacterized protein n=1 Tax=Oryza meyeriana var. granulata TaxID=110450 RepID=A0A6G1E5U8_9ORYZ|nr:hypothetical protein E2562_033452 [Oryza meyeriana var. granulata]
MKASAMLKRKEEYATILAFNVRVMPEAEVLASESGVKILTANTIAGENPQEKTRLYGHHFDESNELISQISRRSIDVLKEYYRDEMNDENWLLIRRLKKLLEIA